MNVQIVAPLIQVHQQQSKIAAVVQLQNSKEMQLSLKAISCVYRGEAPPTFNIKGSYSMNKKYLLLMTLLCFAAVFYLTDAPRDNTENVINLEEAEQRSSPYITSKPELVENLQDLEINEVQHALNANQPTSAQDILDNTDPVEILISNIDGSEGLNKESAMELITRDDYLNVLNVFTKNNHESFEVQDSFQQRMERMIEENDLDMSLNLFNCNDSLCAASLSYEEDLEIDNFINKSFVENTEHSVSIIVQPVIINGTKELRLVFNYKNNSILVNDV